ncbi:putative PAB1-binding protein [Triangularia setosa]|uniref:PAB1-binding protein n=1 Tax=Triangularia setosa TaxID=2587417 RepID=A0AAN6W583_9PEZI|nr:putative PAB1-binding protein [Podospora setosa]
MEDRSTTPLQSTTSDVKSPTQRPLYSSKLGDQRKEATTSGQPARQQQQQQQQPPVTKAWTPSSRNPLTGRSQTPQTSFNSQNKQSVTNSLREGQRKKLPNSAELANGARRDQTQMMVQKKDVMDARVVPGNAGKNDGKGANGNRSGFKTDSSISNSRLGAGRALQPWTPPPDTTTDFSLETSKDDVRGWDQFATHERMFGKKSDYDERIYTTEIDKSHPNYEQRIAQADKIARQIEGEVPKFAHVAEERIMDFSGGDGRDEEEKYSGVARQDFPLVNTSRENKYTPPARRAPTGQSTVKGAPVDPAIISSQLKGAPASAQPTPKADDVKVPAATATPAQPAVEKVAEPKVDNKASEVKAPEAKPEAAAVPPKPETKEPVASRPSAAPTRVAFPGKTGGPSAANNVEREVLNAFKQFSIKERKQADAARHSKARVDKEVKLTELKKFSKDFKLSTPVPKDLIPIIAKDPAKQQQIQEKALQNAADIAKKRQAEAALKEKESAAAKANQVKAAAEQSNASTPAATTDSRASSRPTAPQHSNSSGAPGRHSGGRASYHNNNGTQPPYGQYNRNGRGAQLPPGAQATGQLAQRLRNVEQQKMQHPHMAQHPQPDMRLPPTGPANNVDPAYGRRISGVPPNYLGPKLNPNSHEFRPNAFAQPFNPMNPINPINAVIPSQASSPRSSVNNIMEVPIMTPPAKGQLVRRKTKAIDIKKCFVLSNMETIQPPSNPKKTWDDNDGFRPAFDHPPTWRAVEPEKEEPKDSTMSMTYNEYFEKVPRAGAAIATPNPTHAMPQIPHQHQLPPYLQHGAQGMAHRQSPHMPPMQMQAGQHGHGPHGPYNPEDHRMMHSNSAQSFASPRMGQVPMAYPPSVNAPGQMPYGQPVMPQYMNHGAPQMGQFRSFSNNPQFMPQQPHHMGAPIMGQPPFIPPNGMAVPGPMYPVSGPPFMPPGAVPPQPMVGSNGFPSPGRSAAAPMMAHQGSHQGQPVVYGMSPAMTYQQPAYTPQQGQGKFSGQRPPQ